MPRSRYPRWCRTARPTCLPHNPASLTTRLPPQGVLLVFAGVLLYSAYGLLTEGEEEEEDLSQNPIVKLTTRYLPSTPRPQHSPNELRRFVQASYRREASKRQGSRSRSGT